MKVREYKKEDSENVRNLIFSILEKEYPFDRIAYKDTDINDISGTYGGEGDKFFVAEKAEKVVGTIGVKQDASDTALIRRLFVSESHRKQGLGSALLKEAIAFCKSEGYKTVIFRATDRMKSAMDLCKKTGFKETDNLEVSGFHIHKFDLKI